MSGPTYRKEHRIETPRLVLRSAVPGDAQAIADLRGNPVNNPFGSADSDEAATYLRRMGNWHKASADGVSAFLVIVLKDAESVSGEGKLIGFGGFNEFRWGKSLLDGPAQADRASNVLEADVGAQIDTALLGLGYGREAVVALAEYAFVDLGADHVSCNTELENEPWRALMGSIGLGAKEEALFKSEAEKGKARDGDGGVQEGWVYHFHKVHWAAAKAYMQEAGKWPL